MAISAIYMGAQGCRARSSGESSASRGRGHRGAFCGTMTPSSLADRRDVLTYEPEMSMDGLDAVIKMVSSLKVTTCSIQIGFLKRIFLSTRPQVTVAIQGRISSRDLQIWTPSKTMSSRLYRRLMVMASSHLRSGSRLGRSLCSQLTHQL